MTSATGGCISFGVQRKEAVTVNVVDQLLHTVLRKLLLLLFLYF